MDDLKFTSELASVMVRPNNEANGPHLETTDLDTGATVFLDPLQLRILTRLTPSEVEAFFKYSLKVPDSEGTLTPM